MSVTTLLDHLEAGGDWPDELEPVTTSNTVYPSAVCHCGRVRPPVMMLDVLPPGIGVSEHISRARRASRTVRGETNPRWLCTSCLSAMRVMEGWSRTELRRRLGA